MATAKKTAQGATPRFQAILSLEGQAVLDQRSKITFNQTKNAMVDKVASLKRQREALEIDMLNLTDLSVETRDSLRPGSKDYKPQNWVEQVCDITEQLVILDEKIAIAEQVALEYFNITPEVAETEE